MASFSAGKRTLWRILALINRVVPKADQALICTWPDYEDTFMALLPELTIRFGRVICLQVAPHSHTPILPSNAVVTHHRSLAGIWSYLRSRYVVVTHGLYGSLDPPSSQTVVNVWHGMPIKRIGLADDTPPTKATYVVATSPEFRDILAATWEMPWERVLITGQPRTDRMLTVDRDAIRSRLVDKFGAFNRLLLWLPTFRQTDVGERTDGVEYDTIFGFPDIDVDDLSRRMVETRSVLLVKPHPMSVVRHQAFEDHPGVHGISDDWLTACQITLYELLGVADGLISDVSSAWLDFLLVDRPILIAMADLEEYSKTRGLFFDFNEILPGPLVTNNSELVDQLHVLLSGQDAYKARRQEVRNRFHTYLDAGSTERLMEATGLR